MSYCPLFKIRFPNFSPLCFHISEWKLIGSFHMKSYRSISTYVTVDLFFISYCLLFKIPFPDFSSLCFHISEWKLQIKFVFRHDWLTFSWVIALGLQFVFQTFLGYDSTFLNESWYQAILTVIYWKVHRNNGCWFKFVGIATRGYCCWSREILIDIHVFVRTTIISSYYRHAFWVTILNGRWSSKGMKNYYFLSEKKEEIWLSPITKAPTPIEMSKGQSKNTNNAKKVRLHSGCGPT